MDRSSAAPHRAASPDMFFTIVPTALMTALTVDLAALMMLMVALAALMVALRMVLTALMMALTMTLGARMMIPQPRRQRGGTYLA